MDFSYVYGPERPPEESFLGLPIFTIVVELSFGDETDSGYASKSQTKLKHGGISYSSVARGVMQKQGCNAR